MASSGSFNTSVASNSALARKLYSVALFAQTQKQPGFSRALTGPAPSTGDAINKLKAQTSKDMPIVRITDLSKTAGDKVSVDVFGTIGGKPTMGDADAEGTGVALTNASMDIKIDLATKVVDAGGKMDEINRQAAFLIAVRNIRKGLPGWDSAAGVMMQAGSAFDIRDMKSLVGEFEENKTGTGISSRVTLNIDALYPNLSDNKRAGVVLDVSNRIRSRMSTTGEVVDDQDIKQYIKEAAEGIRKATLFERLP